jgi:hypothetical protein
MHSSLLLGASAACAALAWLFVSAPASTEPPVPPTPPTANGHYVLVVEGTRNQLAITAASAKTDPWAGVPTGFDSAWRLRIADARGELLADVPLDVSDFDTDPAAPLRPVRVAGCIVRSGAIGMLVSVPAFATAASYTIVRPEPQGEPTAIGTATGEHVRALAGGGR